MLTLIILLQIIVKFRLFYVNAIDLEFGSCPIPNVIDNINIDQLTGDWYEIEKFPTEIEESGRDGKLQIKKLNDNKINIELYLDYDDGKEPLYVAFDAKLKSKNGEFDIDIDMDLPGILQPTLYVIDTDYDNYLGFWSCLSPDFGLFNVEVAWIFARNTTLSNDLLKVVHDAYDRQDLNSDNFVGVNQGDCDYLY